MSRASTPPPCPRRPRRWLHAIVTLGSGLLVAGLARADVGGICFSACDIVTQKAVGPFRGANGEINRPALIPGFPAELSIRPGICDTRSTAPGFEHPSTGALLELTEVTLSFVFTPPAGTPNVVVLKEDCASLDTSTCGATPVSCIDGAATSGAMQFISRALPGSASLERRLRFQFPDTSAQAGSVCFGGGAQGASCSLDEDCPGGACKPVTLTGPLAVAVTLNDAVPCGLSAAACRDFADAVTCIDDVFKLDGTCDTTPETIEPSAVNVTALPAPFKIADVCAEGSDPACRAPARTPPVIPFTQDKQGNLMSVLDGREVLIVIDEESFPRLSRASLALRDASDPAMLNPLTPSSGKALAVNYAPLHPVFQAEPGPEGAVATLDAAFSIQRATRFFCAEDPNVACAADSECTCTVDSLRDAAGAPLPFPLPASAAGVGPVLGECPLAADGLPNCRLLGAVTFETLFAADDPDRALAAPVSECIELPQVVENADADRIDVVMTLIDRLTFQRQDIGRSDAAGRAVTRVYLSPTVAISTHDVESEILAFLEPELFECELGAETCDVNGNGSTSDHNLRAFALGATGSETAVDLLPDPVPARPDLNVEGAAVAVSNGLVFFRAPAEASPRSLELASASASGEAADGNSLEPSLSPGGDFVAFTTLATNLGFHDRNRVSDVVLKDRATGEVIPVSVRDRESCEERVRLADDASRSPAVSDGGRLVAFSSLGERLLGPPTGPPNDRNEVEDVFVYDLASCRVTRVSVGPGGVESNGASFNPSISADGNLVVFESVATNLDPDDTTPDLDVYLYDRSTGTTSLVSPAGGESPSGRAVAVDGSVAFSDGTQVLVSDGDTLELISLDPNGAPGDTASLTPSISASGRFVAYHSLATNIEDIGETPGEPPDFDVFVFDRVTGTTLRAGVLRAGVRRVPRECRVTGPPGAFDPDGDSTQAQTTEDGRFLVYTTDSTNLVPSGGASIVVVEDLATGTLSNLSEAASGAAADGPSSGGSLSRSGAVVAFQSGASNLLAGTSAASNVYVSELDVSGSGSGSVLGVLDTANGSVSVFAEHPAEFVRVQNGAAVFIAPGQNVKLFRLACDADGGLCDASCAGGCSAVIEDLLRPGISSADTIAIDDTLACAVVLDPNGAPVPACHRIGTDPAASLDDIAPPGIEARAIQLAAGKLAFQTLAV